MFGEGCDAYDGVVYVEDDEVCFLRCVFNAFIGNCVWARCCVVFVGF